MSNIVIRLDKYLKRKELAKAAKTHPGYLTNLAKQETISGSMEWRLIEAAKELIDKLNEIVKK